MAIDFLHAKFRDVHLQQGKYCVQKWELGKINMDKMRKTRVPRAQASETAHWTNNSRVLIPSLSMLWRLIHGLMHRTKLIMISEKIMSAELWLLGDLGIIYLRQCASRSRQTTICQFKDYDSGVSLIGIWFAFQRPNDFIPFNFRAATFRGIIGSLLCQFFRRDFIARSL